MAFFTKGTIDTIDTIITANAPVVNITQASGNPNYLGDGVNSYSGTTTPIDAVIVQSTKKNTASLVNWWWLVFLGLIPFAKYLFCKKNSTNKRRY